MRIKMRIVSIALALVMCLGLVPVALAAEKGDTSVTDRTGHVYTLSNAILGTTSWTFYDDMAVGNTTTVTVYLIPKDTVITLPSGRDLYVAVWYAPDDSGREGWDTFWWSEFIPAGMDVPFNSEMTSSNGTSGSTADVEDSTLRIYSSNGSVIFRGVDADGDNSSFTPFKDVALGAYYLEPVSWAVGKGITKGTSETTFSPDNTCTRGEIMTFLWRAVGEPRNWIMNVYSDVKKEDYFYEAARWGYTEDMVPPPTFDADTPCTRSMTVAYLWKASGSPSMLEPASFSDIPSDAEYANAVAWAVATGVTTGTSDTTFSPDKICTRGEIVTFLHRAFAKK